MDVDMLCGEVPAVVRRAGLHEHRVALHELRSELNRPPTRVTLQFTTGGEPRDGKPWPVASDTVIWLAPGSHSIQPAAVKPVLRLVDLNAELHSAAAIPGGIEFSYQSGARALATFEAPPASFQIDGVEATTNA